MSFDDTLSTTITLADQAAAEAKAASDDAAMFTPAGPAERRLHEHLMGLPVGDVRKLVVLMYCGQHGERNVGIADGFIKSPKEELVDQLMSKGRLASHLRAGRMTVPPERLRRFECGD
jgi:hypothetical protein